MKELIGVVVFVGLTIIGFSFGTVYGVLAMLLCYAVCRAYEGRIK